MNKQLTFGITLVFISLVAFQFQEKLYWMPVTLAIALVLGILLISDAATIEVGNKASKSLRQAGFAKLPKYLQWLFLILIILSLVLCSIFLPPGNSWVGYLVFTFWVFVFIFISIFFKSAK